MSTPNPRPTPPSLATLTARFLASPPAAADDAAAVEPHDAPAGFRTDARTTWAEALLAVKLAAGTPATTPVPASWAGATRALTPRYAVALCVGNFPQMLGDMTALFGTADLSALATAEASRDAGGTRLGDPGRKADSVLAALVTAAGHRLAGAFDDAATTLAAAESACVGPWRAVWENERAALLWDRGRHAEAVAAWRKLPDGAVTAFNLGMAELFSGQPAAARKHLAAAAAMIPEASGWNHLARLYLALCDGSSV